MEKIIEIWNNWVALVEGLDQAQFYMLAAVTALLILIIAFRKGGYGAVIALAIIAFIGYILYQSNLFDFYNENERGKIEREKVLEKELNK